MEELYRRYDMADLKLPKSNTEIIILSPCGIVLIGNVTISPHQFKLHGAGCWLVDDLSSWPTHVKQWKYLDEIFD